MGRRDGSPSGIYPVSQREFLTTGMTPRAWRMISYCCIGFLLYSLLLFMEMLQNFQLSQIDNQLRALDRQDQMGSAGYEVSP